MEKKRYTTQRPHGKYPAGTRCWAERLTEVIRLTFDDGAEIDLRGDRYYLIGIEWPPYSIQAEMDRLVMEDIERSILTEL